MALYTGTPFGDLTSGTELGEGCAADGAIRCPG